MRLATLFAYILLFLCTHTHLKGQASQSGIPFRQGDFKGALAAAQSAKKPLFVEVYLTGCPHCEALAPILADRQVGDFYSANFVSWKIEANAPESVVLQKEKAITYPEFPLMLFFDTAGQLMHVATPAEQASKESFVQEVISIGQTALNPVQRTSGYSARFDAGERDIAFLINYGKYCKTRKDNLRLHQLSDALGSALSSSESLNSQVGFYCLQRLIDDVDNPAATYFFSHLGEFTAAHPVNEVKEAGEGIIFRSLYGAKGDQYPASKIAQMRAYMVTLGVPANEASARTLLKELDAHLRANNTRAAVDRFNEYRRQNTTIGLADYAYLMHYFNDKATDNTYLPEMPLWAADGLKTAKADQSYSKLTADIHYELAVAYQKLGQKPQALQQAQQGLAIAQKAKVETERYQKQLISLR